MSSGRSFSQQVLYMMGRGYWLLMRGCGHMMLGRGFINQNLDSKIRGSLWVCLGACMCVCVCVLVP